MLSLFRPKNLSFVIKNTVNFYKRAHLKMEKMAKVYADMDLLPKKRSQNSKGFTPKNDLKLYFLNFFKKNWKMEIRRNN